MTEMRRNLQQEELVARREKYLADREKKREFDEEQARHQPSPMAELRKLEMQARLDLQREEAANARQERRTAAIEKEAVKREAENKERLAWLEELQRDYSVDGVASTTFSVNGRKKRTFLTPEVRPRQSSPRLHACAQCSRRRATLRRTSIGSSPPCSRSKAHPSTNGLAAPARLRKRTTSCRPTRCWAAGRPDPRRAAAPARAAAPRGVSTRYTR